MGNYVDDGATVLTRRDELSIPATILFPTATVTIDKQREDEYTRMLSQKIVTEYHRINRVFASHLVAFVAFEMWQKKHPKLDLFGLLRFPEEDQD